MIRLRAVSNDEVADVLERVADLLEAQDANVYQVRAYLQGAGTVRELERPVAALLDEGGLDALEALPHIGKSLASAIRELVDTGRLGMLDRLEGQVSPEDLFTTVPGIGDELAHRIHAELGIETLEELELCAHDGRLSRVEGFGPRRVRAVRETLAGMLSRSSRRRARRLRALERAGGEPPGGGDVVTAERVPRTGAGAGPDILDRPTVEALLSVDAEYRRKAEGGALRTIAPRRFNPSGDSWLPILHTEREAFRLTALFSNTARAHQLGKTRDWVVIYFERDGHEDQCTVVTEHRGPLAGRRVVRGREKACRDHYGAR